MVRLPNTSKRWGWGLALTAGVLIGGPGSTIADDSPITLDNTVTLDGSAPLEAPPALIKPLEAPARLERLSDDQAQPALQSVDTEIVRERYLNRAVKIERQIVRDAEGNFVNHGSWQMWNEKGQSMGRGKYNHGRREGLWLRTFQPGEAPMFSGAWGQLFNAPLLASGTFVDGELAGVWAIVDAQERPVASWHYEHDQRHGKSVWYFPNGQKYREADYREGQLDGKFVEFAADGSVVAEENYVDGRRRGVQADSHESGGAKIEAEYLFAKEIVETKEDWWTGVATTKVLRKSGRDMKHGHYTTWYRNGQKAMEGAFREDQPIGKFVWWHPNGLRAIEGEYVGAKQAGRWSWWYESGKRFIQGQYQNGDQIGQWTWWNETGAVVESSTYAISTHDAPVAAYDAPVAVEEPVRRQPRMLNVASPRLRPIGGNTAAVESAESEVESERATRTSGQASSANLVTAPELFAIEPPHPPKFRPTIRAATR